PLDPVRDGRGILWYAPLVPMQGELAARYIQMVERVCTSFGFAPMVTLTTISGSCFDSTVPLVFEPERAAKAQACYNALVTEGQAMGFVPYRLGIDSMQRLVSSDVPFWQTVGRLKETLDPENILSPGRYAP